METEWSDEEKKQVGYIDERTMNSVPTTRAWLFPTLMVVAFAVLFFWIGWWASPGDPSEIDQVRGCAGLNDTAGYTVKVAKPNGAVVLNVTCTYPSP